MYTFMKDIFQTMISKLGIGITSIFGLELNEELFIESIESIHIHINVYIYKA